MIYLNYGWQRMQTEWRIKMSETKIEYLAGEREAEIRKHLRSLATFVLISIITDKSQLKDFDEWIELLI